MIESRCLILIIFLCLSIRADAQKTNEERRQEEFIKQFVDTYRQAYDKRDINFIKNIFSEQALIITQTLELRKGSSVYKNRGKKYRIVVENKRQYIKRLTEIFKSSSYLRLETTVPRIKEHSQLKGLYGVQFFQTWEGNGENTFSGELHSKGSILLVIDFSTDPHMPIIHIRTWQPECILKTERKFDLYDFKIVK